MKRLFHFLIAALFCAFPFSACVKGRSPDGGKYVSPPEYAGNMRLDIGACFGPPVTNYHGYSPANFNQTRFDEMAAAGFNMLDPGGWLNGTQGDGYSMARCRQMLEYAEKAGVGVWIGDFNLCNYRYQNIQFTADFDEYIAHPAVLGNHLCDEPSVNEFDDLANLRAKYKERTDKPGFINLYPSYYNVAGVGGNYEKYVGDFMETVQPDILSYDHYPLLNDAWDGGMTVRENYFTDMETIRYAAKKYGVPVHNYIQSAEHGNYPALLERDFRWQIAVNQAFGIFKFTYFTYWTPNVTGYNTALINPDGTVSELYGFAKTANQEALAWSNVYLNFKWQGTAAIAGGNGDPFGLFYGLRYAGYEDGIDGVQSVASGEDVLCGIFNAADGNKGFMLTNATNPYEEKTASVTIKFDKAYSGVQIFEKGVASTIGLDKNGGIQIELESGEGKFLIPLKKA